EQNSHTKQKTSKGARQFTKHPGYVGQAGQARSVFEYSPAEKGVKRLIRFVRMSSEPGLHPAGLARMPASSEARGRIRPMSVSGATKNNRLTVRID
ncbi:MAG: hypothetical protein L0H37_08435, partial [Nitrosospira sp.]|nr:hypothetical protein [Nitrosospira sp.]